MVPILMYHEVSDRAPVEYSRYTVTPRTFDGHLRVLRALGYQSIPLSQVTLPVTSLPRHAVAITVDDGLEDAVRWAAPILARHGMTATFFLVAGLIGQTSRWTRATRGCEMRLADVHAVRELAAAGFTCGSHTMTHPRLTLLDEARCRAELRDSKHRLEDVLGEPVRQLAYPFGAVGPAIRDAAAECGYELACTVEKRVASASDDPLLLPRVHVRGTDSRADFICGLRVGRAVREHAHVTITRWRRLVRAAVGRRPA